MGGGPLAGYLFLTTLVHHTFYFIFRSIPLGTDGTYGKNRFQHIVDFPYNVGGGNVC